MWVCINPGNPTGTVVRGEEWEELDAATKDGKGLLLIDVVYLELA